MVRHLKFRAWDGKEMIEVTDLVFYPDGTYKINDDVDSQYEQWPLMQFTGTCDSKGKEIWEGDIVKVLNNKESTLKEYWFPVYVIENDGWTFKTKWIEGGKPSDADYHIRYWGSCEVLGNIYEYKHNRIILLKIHPKAKKYTGGFLITQLDFPINSKMLSDWEAHYDAQISLEGKAVSIAWFLTDDKEQNRIINKYWLKYEKEKDKDKKV